MLKREMVETWARRRRHQSPAALPKNREVRRPRAAPRFAASSKKLSMRVRAAVKFRSNNNSNCAPRGQNSIVARRRAENGVKILAWKAVAVHPRKLALRLRRLAPRIGHHRRRQASRENSLIGNGTSTAAKCRAHGARTGCDAVMIAAAAAITRDLFCNAAAAKTGRYDSPTTSPLPFY